MDAQVKMKFFADAQAAERAIVNLEKKYTDLENKISQVSRTSRKASEQSVADSLKQELTFQRMVTAVSQFGTHIVTAMRQQSELRQEVERTGIALDDAIRKFRIQQGLQALDSDSSRTLAGNVAGEAGVSPEAVIRIARQLESSGFSDPLRSGTAKAVIATLQATAQDVENAPLEEIVSSFAQQLNASGQDRTAVNLLKLGVQFRGMFATSLEATDLPDFAKVRGLATQVGVSQEEFFGSAAVVRDVMSAAEGSTGLGNFMSKLAAPKPNQLDAMGTLGVKPEDVDFIGESILDVATRLNTAVQALPEEQRVKALAGLFGAEKSQLGAADALLKAAGSGRFAEYIGMAGDQSAFEFSVREARGGPGSALRRLQGENTIAAAEGLDAGYIPDVIIEEANKLESQRTRNQYAAEGSDAKLFMFDLAEAFYSFLPARFNIGEEGMQSARSAMSGGSDFSLKELQASLDANTAETKRQNDMLEGSRPGVNRNAHAE